MGLVVPDNGNFPSIKQFLVNKYLKKKIYLCLSLGFPSGGFIKSRIGAVEGNGKSGEPACFQFVEPGQWPPKKKMCWYYLP